MSQGSKNASIIYIGYSVTDAILYEYVTSFRNASSILDHTILRVYDSNMERISISNDRSGLKQNNRIIESQSCTTDNVLGCMNDNCANAERTERLPRVRLK